jgi:hypothetical protein
LVDVQIIGLQKMLKLVSTPLETHAHTSLKFANVAARKGGQQAESQTEGNVANRAGEHRVSVSWYTVLPSFVFISNILLIRAFLRVNHPV